MLDPYDDAFTARDWETPAEGTVRFALAGLGWFGREEAIPAIEEGSYGEVTVAASGSVEKAERVAEEHDLAAGVTYEELHDGVAADEYDALYVATPNAAHLEHAEAAARLGKHVLCEKPMEADSERAAAMVEACEEAGVTLMVAYRMQTDRLLRRTRELIREGVVGEVHQVAGSCAGPFVNRDSPDQWRMDPDLAGGGALYDIGVYPLNTARFLLGADPTSLTGTVVRDDEFLRGMDLHASFDMSFPDGVTVSCRTSYDAAAEGYLSVLGSEGRLFVEPAFEFRGERTLRVERDGVRTEVTVGGNEFVEEFDYFAHAILTGRDVEPDGEDGLTDVRVLEAVYESDETGRRVDL